MLFIKIVDELLVVAGTYILHKLNPARLTYIITSVDDHRLTHIPINGALKYLNKATIVIPLDPI